MRNAKLNLAYIIAIFFFSFIANSDGEQQQNAFSITANKYEKYLVYTDEGTANIVISSKSTRAVSNIKFRTFFNRGKFFRLIWIEIPGNDDGIKLPNGSIINIISEIVSRNNRHEFISGYANKTFINLESLIFGSVGASHGISQYIPVFLLGYKKTILRLPLPACKYYKRSLTYVCSRHHKNESVSYWIDEKTMLIKKITSYINMQSTRIKTTIIYNKINIK